MLLKAPVMPTSYPNTRLILQKIFGGKLVSKESIGKPMMGSNGGALLVYGWGIGGLGNMRSVIYRRLTHLILRISKKEEKGD
jgi:hypothetical protein